MIIKCFILYFNCNDDRRNEFDNRSSRSPTPVLMVIDDDCYDDNQEHHDNRDNSDEKTESSTATESESYESLYDSFDDNNTFEVLQKGLYSSDNESSDDGINLTEGNIRNIYLFI